MGQSIALLMNMLLPYHAGSDADVDAGHEVKLMQPGRAVVVVMQMMMQMLVRGGLRRRGRLRRRDAGSTITATPEKCRGPFHKKS